MMLPFAEIAYALPPENAPLSRAVGEVLAFVQRTGPFSLPMKMLPFAFEPKAR